MTGLVRSVFNVIIHASHAITLPSKIVLLVILTPVRNQDHIDTLFQGNAYVMKIIQKQMISSAQDALLGAKLVQEQVIGVLHVQRGPSEL